MSSQNKIISPELEQFMRLHNISNLADILLILPEDLLKMYGFGMRLMVEVHKLKTS